jgi:glycosyltransferase involved in cell wall biosynthesis
VRIAIVHNHFTAAGGAEQLIASHARWLADAGHRLQVVALQVDRAWATAQLPGHTVHEVGLPPGVHRMEQITAPMLPMLAERARRFLEDVDVVLAYNFPAVPIAAMASEARRVWYACEPFRSLYLREANPMTVAHLALSDRQAAGAAVRQIQRRLRRERLWRLIAPWKSHTAAALRAADAASVAAMDAVVSLSAFGRGCIAAATGRADATVIPPMVEFPLSPLLRRPLQRSAPQILVQARLGIPKNIDTLLAGFAHFRARHPNAVVHIVGSGSQRRPLERLAARLAPYAVQFHDYLSTASLDALSAACDVFALAPVDEPFGLVFPEAAARGLLLVGPEHGGPREILCDGALGALCDPFSAASIADALERTVALSDAQVSERRAAAAASMRWRYAADVIGPQLEAVLRGAGNAAGTAGPSPAPASQAA